MAVSVKDYVDSMKSVSASTKATQSSSGQSNLKTQQLLAQLIEALSYANAVDVRKKTLNAPASTDPDKTGKQVLDQMKSQEKLIQQLAEGQKLDKQQKIDLIKTIDKFYEFIGAQEINYTKFAANMEKFAKQDLPEAVKTRIKNDSKDAGIIAKDQKAKEGTVLPILKKIRNLLEDSAEDTKQFSKKLFVSLDQFREGFIEAFNNLEEGLEKGGDIFDNIIDAIKLAGLAFMGFQGMFKDGNFKWGQVFKHLSKGLMPAFQKGFMGILGDSFGGILKGIGSVLGKFGLKGAGTVAKIGGIGSKFLKKVPLIGTLMSVWMGIERWKQGDYTGALIEFGSGIAAMFPGVGTLISIALDLINLGKDTGFFNNLFSGGSDKPFKPASGLLAKLFGGKDKDAEKKQSGDAPIKWNNESGGYSPKGLTQSAKTAAENLNRLLGGGMEVTSAMRDPNKMMPLWNSAKPIPGNPKNRINKYGNIMAHPMNSNHRFGTAIDVPKRYWNEKFKQLAKKAGFTYILPESTAIHLEVPKKGTIADVKKTDTALGSATNEPFYETPSLVAAESESPESFSDIMAAFQKFNEDIVAGVADSATPQSSMQVPTVSEMTTGTPSSDTATQVAAQTRLAATSIKQEPVTQIAQTAPAQSAPDTMDTDIQDTSLALMNSILFQ